MRQFLFIISLLFCFIIGKSQDHSIPKNVTLDLFSWKDFDFTGHKQELADGNIIRQYDSTFTKIKWELLCLSDNQFYYSEYKDTVPIATLQEGYLIPIETKLDTFYGFDIENFTVDSSKRSIETTEELVKHGKWTYFDNYIRYSGHFKNGIKSGYWYLWKGSNQDFRKILYQNDSIISEEQLNIIRYNNQDSLTNHLIGKWSMNLMSQKANFYKNQLGTSYPYVILKEDNKLVYNPNYSHNRKKRYGQLLRYLSSHNLL